MADETEKVPARSDETSEAGEAQLQKLLLMLGWSKEKLVTEAMKFVAERRKEQCG